MNYNFDKEISRYNTDSYKWDAMDVFFPANPKALPLWVADMDFPCPKNVVEAVCDRARHPIYGYAYTGNDLREAAANWQRIRNHWIIRPEHVEFSNGIIPAICAVIRMFTKPGDNILIQTPVYYPFMETIENNNRNIIENPLIYDGEKWKMDVAGFEKTVKEKKPKLFILCNPHNPVGRAFSEDELKGVADICVNHDVMIFSDEIHSDLMLNGNQHIPIASLSHEISRITITAFAPSKTFNIAGLQGSAVVIEDNEIREKYVAEMARNYFIMSLFAVTAFKAAYAEENVEYVQQLNEYLWKNYLLVDDFMKKETPKIKVQRPEATYLLWLDCRELGLEGENLDRFFTVNAGTALDYGGWFGREAAGYMRLNIGCPKTTLLKGLERIRDAYVKAGY